MQRRQDHQPQATAAIERHRLHHRGPHWGHGYCMLDVPYLEYVAST